MSLSSDVFFGVGNFITVSRPHNEWRVTHVLYPPWTQVQLYPLVQGALPSRTALCIAD